MIMWLDWIFEDTVYQYSFKYFCYESTCKGQKQFVAKNQRNHSNDIFIPSRIVLILSKIGL